MVEAARVAANLTALAFVALAVAMAFTWFRRRGRAEGLLAISLILLALVAAVGRIQAFVGVYPILGVISILAFLGSGYFVLLFRDAFIPLSPLARQGATSLLVASLLIGVAYALFTGTSKGLVATVTAIVLVVAWSAFVGEPIVRFWLVSRSFPRMQRARMRALSAGFAMLIGILVIAVLGGSALQSPIDVLVIQLLALAVTPLIYFSFDPPTLLRGYWRLKEQAEMQAAMQDLLVYAPGQQALAEKAIPWAMRLVGAQGALIIGADHSLLAGLGIEPDVVEAVIAEHLEADDRRVVSINGRTIVALPLPLSDGRGLLAVEASPFAPIFGAEELQQLESYAAAITAGLERAKVSTRLVEMERTKSHFLNLASHELRRPVTVIRGYVSMLENGMGGPLNELGRKAAQTMRAQILEMNELIEQMLDSARLEDGQMVLHKELADLRDAVSEAVEGVRPLVDDKHTVELDLPTRPVMVHIDVAHIQTILSNLMSNALKYSPDGGVVKLEITRRAGLARVSVSDNGVGIAPNDLSTLFTRFGRIANPRIESVPGTGLGLYLGRQLAHLHGGEITVESRPGEGSTFTLQLPVSATAPIRERGPRVRTAKERV